MAVLIDIIDTENILADINKGQQRISDSCIVFKGVVLVFGAV
jgi:hypothetical protein